MAFFDRIRTRLIGKRPNLDELDKVLAELKEAHKRNAEAAADLIAVCKRSEEADREAIANLKARMQELRSEG